MGATDGIVTNTIHQVTETEAPIEPKCSFILSAADLTMQMQTTADLIVVQETVTLPICARKCRLDRIKS